MLSRHAEERVAYFTCPCERVRWSQCSGCKHWDKSGPSASSLVDSQLKECSFLQFTNFCAVCGRLPCQHTSHHIYTVHMQLTGAAHGAGTSNASEISQPTDEYAELVARLQGMCFGLLGDPASISIMEGGPHTEEERTASASSVSRFESSGSAHAFDLDLGPLTSQPQGPPAVRSHWHAMTQATRGSQLKGMKFDESLECIKSLCILPFHATLISANSETCGNNYRMPCSFYSMEAGPVRQAVPADLCIRHAAKLSF